MGIEVSRDRYLNPKAYHLLGLATSFLGYSGWTKVRGGHSAAAWKLQSGDLIHSDFERGFIRAETVAYATTYLNTVVWRLQKKTEKFVKKVKNMSCKMAT